jgi:hypothetical protein
MQINFMAKAAAKKVKGIKKLTDISVKRLPDRLMTKGLSEHAKRLKEQEEEENIILDKTIQYVRLKKEDVGTILEKMYGNESNFLFGWAWDLGFTNIFMNGYYLEGYNTYVKEYYSDLKSLPDVYREAYYSVVKNDHDIAEVFSGIAYLKALLAPESWFADWYRTLSKANGKKK